MQNFVEILRKRDKWIINVIKVKNRSKITTSELIRMKVKINNQVNHIRDFLWK